MIEENKEEYIVIGDFNARIREERRNDEEGWDIRKKNKDRTINSRSLINLVKEIGDHILNGTIGGDKEGEVTYVGAKGCSVIDYAIVNENCNNIVKRFRIMKRVDSDHMPLSVEIKEEKHEERRGG